MGISIFKASGCSCINCNPPSKKPTRDERCKLNVPDIYGSRPNLRPQTAKKKTKKKATPPPNVPNPSKFKILEMRQIDKWTIVKVQYDEAVNYEGKKIMVYEATPEQIQKCKVLDPHFCDGKHLSPFARFEPTKDGWRAAMRFVLTAH